jgi:hypothetical protein
MPVITSTFENVSDIGVCLGLCLGPPANAGVRSKRGAVHRAQSITVVAVPLACGARTDCSRHLGATTAWRASPVETQARKASSKRYASSFLLKPPLRAFATDINEAGSMWR